MLVKTPMTMMDFFRKSQGTWLTQREVHHFDLVQNESGVSNLIVKVIESNDPRILEVCQEQNVDPAVVSGAGSFMWQDNLDDVPPNENYAAMLIDVPNDETGLSGRLLRNRGYVENAPVVCRYWFGQDGVLTIDTEYDNNVGQERCWFITDDFRVRVSSVRLMNGVQLTAYCSERRCVSDQTLESLLAQNRDRAA
jgi:hypothetical protein